LQIGQPQGCLDISMDDANVPPDLTWQLRTGVNLSATALGGPMLPQSAAGRESDTSGTLNAGPSHRLKKTAIPGRKPLVNRPFLMPTSPIFRSNRPKSSGLRTATITTHKKVTSAQNRKAKIKGLSPMKLISHLEDEFQSNSTVSRDFKHKSSEILGLLKNLIDHERIHGSSGASLFLSHEEEDGDDLSSAGTPKTVSPSFRLPLRTPDFNSGFEIRPDALNSDSMSTLCTETYNLPSRQKIAKTIYHCTYPKCAKYFWSPADWKRHEEIETHWMQKRYMCLECDIAVPNPDDTFLCIYCSTSASSLDEARVHSLQCQDARVNMKTFARKDKFRDHLRDEHSIANIRNYMESWVLPVKSEWPPQCGFCGVILNTWDERATHIEGHYKQGSRITDWKLPFPVEDDSVMIYSDAGHDNDGDNGGGGGRNQDQSRLQSYSYHLGGWHGEHSSAAIVAGQENSSTSIHKDQQNYCLEYSYNNYNQQRQTIDDARRIGFRSRPCSREEQKSLLRLVSPNSKRRIAGYALLELSAIIHNLRMDDVQEGPIQDTDSKALDRNLDLAARSMDHSNSKSQTAMKVWESALRRENCKEDVVAMRRRLHVICVMLSESPSKRLAATVIQLFDTRSIPSFRDSYSQVRCC
jgi:hypothetical protein